MCSVVIRKGTNWCYALTGCLLCSGSKM